VKQRSRLQRSRTEEALHDVFRKPFLGEAGRTKTHEIQV
jgi:hypothetical protein